MLAIQASHLPKIIVCTILFFSCATVFAFASNPLVSQNPKITIDQDRKVTIYEVFEIIGNQTDCTFIYQSDIFKGLPKIELKKGIIKVNELLEHCLPLSNFNIITTKENYITITLRISKAFPQGNIKGVVTDSLGIGMAGVNILIKNSTKGTQSDLDGQYTIIAHPSDTLVFTYMGFKSQEIAVESQTIINVVMQPDATALDQVVINAGYYKVSDKEKTGSIARITAVEIENQPVSNPLAALQGRMAGVQVIQNSGVAGSGFDVKIRGKNSIAAGNNPLYVIDGVPFMSQSLSSRDVSGGILPGGNFSPFSFLNPSDIESIEVLKDADATAIYGSRGANGVVLITTKKDRIGATKYAVTAKSGIGQIANTQKLLNTQQYLKMRAQAFSNDGISEYPFYEYDVNGTWDPNRYTDWQKELLGGTAYFQEYQASVSGGNRGTSYFLSGGFHNESTVFPEDDRYKRMNGLAKISHSSPNEGFKVSLSTAYTHENNNLPGADLSYQALTLPPNAPNLYNEDGTLNWEDGTFNNPMAALEGDLLSKRNSLLANALVEVKILKGLAVKANLGYQDSNLAEYRTNPHTRFPPQYGFDSRASAIYTNDGSRTSWIVEPQLSYVYKMPKSKLEVLMGYSAQNEKTDTFSQYAEGFANNSQILNLTAANFIQVTNDTEQLYKYQAVFGRLNYNYDGRYIINLTGRRDGSSRFGPNNRFANFGAVGAAWTFSEEGGVKKALPFLNYGKLRGSFGTTGNDQIGDYRYLNSYTSTGIPYNGTIGLYPTALYNPDFGWEENRKAELAVELGLFNSRINTTINYYRNRSSNQLVEVPLPGTTGFSSILANLDALVENRGWEFELNSINLDTGKWTWNTSFNLTIPKNELLAFPNLESSTYINSYVIGEPITINKVLHFTGVDPETGVYTFEDFNGDGKISVPEDSQAIVDTAPKFYGGISNTIAFGNLEMHVFFQYSKQNALNIYSLGVTPGVMANQPVEVLDAWTQEGDQSNIQAFTTGSNFERSMAAYNLAQSDAAFSDASYLRLKNISITYNLRNIITKSSNAKIFIQGQNLYTWTAYKGQDPEQNQGFIPALRWMSAGLTLTF
ncbi:TonB-linked outer membrane protein, SusC/RagA family [Aequorivita viscosa]|uniref:TonB-linked outer membrane protein, SusC/RagA family n=2 Tax=Aequorivita viscosa TaxID=797419 RepID=A0A1M6LZM9_9FLAO|nr:TonB-linked outer membrane protein, SusC/RagA family [Aequorivita viscosa]SHJ76666.1 TonB-linked outer membrane protein, SusC/RagA family [Aequorivita viscosa]